jgi:hypothetical protein
MKYNSTAPHSFKKFWEEILLLQSIIRNFGGKWPTKIVKVVKEMIAFMHLILLEDHFFSTQLNIT